MNILIRVDGHAGVGYGHLVRCLTLAEQLRDAHGVNCTFVTQRDTPGMRHIQEGGFHLAALDCPNEALSHLTANADLDAIIFDLQAGVTPELLNSVPEEVLTVDLNLTNTSDANNCADMIFNP